MFIKNINEIDRQAWLKQTLTALPQGARILDAGAGELKNRQYCGHLSYVSHKTSVSTKVGWGRRMKACRAIAGIPRGLTWSATLPRYRRQMPASTPFSVAKCGARTRTHPRAR